MLHAFAEREADAAGAAADQLVASVRSMFAVMEQGIDPVLLDCNLPVLAAD